MKKQDEEIDYLAGAKDFFQWPPDTFASVVREAFKIEHNCKYDHQIATVLGISAGRISQILSEPHKLKVETIEEVIRGLRSPKHRSRIIEVWHGECFNELLKESSQVDEVIGKVDEAFLRLISRLIRLRKPERALALVEAALKHDIDDHTRRRLYDQCFYLNFRLDKLSQAMKIASTMVAWGKDTQQLELEGSGLMLQFRILRTMDEVSVKELRRRTEQLHEFSKAVPKSQLPKEYITLQPKLLRQGEIYTVLRYQYSGGDAGALLQAALRDPYVGAKSDLRASIYLALGEYFKAEELLEQAANVSLKDGSFTLTRFSQFAYTRAMLYVLRGEKDQAITYYEGFIKLAEDERFLRAVRLGKRDLTLLRAGLQPPYCQVIRTPLY